MPTRVQSTRMRCVHVLDRSASARAAASPPGCRRSPARPLAATYASTTSSGRDAVDPHHRRRRVADTLPAPPALDAATIAGEVADVHLARGTAVRRSRRRSAPRRCCRGTTTARTPSRAARSRLSSRRAGTAAAPAARGSSRNAATAARSPSAAGSRLARITHSCSRCASSPASRALLEAGEHDLVQRDRRRGRSAPPSACGGGTARRRAACSANRMKSIGNRAERRRSRPATPAAAASAVAASASSATAIVPPRGRVDA